MADGKYRLIVEFRDLYDLVAFAEARGPEVDAFKADGLDLPHGGGSRTFILRRAGSRPDAMRARTILSDEDH